MARSLRRWALRVAFRATAALAPDAAAKWAERLFCTPPRHRPRPADQAFLSSGSRFTVGWEGLELAAWEWGRGPTVVLVHGWGSRTARFAPLTAALVEAGFRVVGYDAPSHGSSTGRLASLPEFTRALERVIQSVGPVYGLVGHSLGGAAAAMALGRGQTARRAVLLAAPADVRVFSDIFAETLAIPAVVQHAMHLNLERRLRFTWEELRLPNVVRGLEASALVMHDRDDVDVPFSHAEQIAAAWAGSSLVATRGLGHRAILGDPGVVRRAAAFLREGVGA